MEGMNEKEVSPPSSLPFTYWTVSKDGEMLGHKGLACTYIFVDYDDVLCRLATAIMRGQFPELAESELVLHEHVSVSFTKAHDSDVAEVELPCVPKPLPTGDKATAVVDEIVTASIKPTNIAEIMDITKRKVKLLSGFIAYPEGDCISKFHKFMEDTDDNHHDNTLTLPMGMPFNLGDIFEGMNSNPSMLAHFQVIRVCMKEVASYRVNTLDDLTIAKNIKYAMVRGYQKEEAVVLSTIRTSTLPKNTTEADLRVMLGQ